MRVFFLVTSVLAILAFARRWDRLHPLRVSHATREAAPAAGSSGGPSGYLDLTLLDRARPRRAAAPPAPAALRRSA